LLPVVTLPFAGQRLGGKIFTGNALFLTSDDFLRQKLDLLLAQLVSTGTAFTNAAIPTTSLVRFAY
jgi:hypothetical protein